MAVVDIPWRLRSQISLIHARVAAKKSASKKAKLTNGYTPAQEGKNAKAPNLAVIGGTRYIGSRIVKHTLQAVVAGRLSSVRIFSSRPKTLDGTFTACGWHTVDYNDISSIECALNGVYIVISAAGMQKNQSNCSHNKENIINAAANAGVQVYVPSEFGTDYNQSRYLENNMFAKKSAHAIKAKHSGLKTVSIFTGLTMERSFLRWIARDGMTWRVVGSPMPLCPNPDSVPDHVRVSSCDLTIRDYPIIYEKVRGIKIKFDIVDLEAARTAWKLRENTIPEGMIGPLIGIMVADGTFDHSRNSMNEALAKESCGLKLRPFDHNLIQDTTRPWEGRILDLD